MVSFKGIKTKVAKMFMCGATNAAAADGARNTDSTTQQHIDERKEAMATPSIVAVAAHIPADSSSNPNASTNSGSRGYFSKKKKKEEKKGAQASKVNVPLLVAILALQEGADPRKCAPGCALLFAYAPPGVIMKLLRTFLDDFNARGLSRDNVPFKENGYVVDVAQEKLLHAHDDDEVKGESDVCAAATERFILAQLFNGIYVNPQSPDDVREAIQDASKDFCAEAAAEEAEEEAADKAAQQHDEAQQLDAVVDDVEVTVVQALQAVLKELLARNADVDADADAKSVNVSNAAGRIRRRRRTSRRSRRRNKRQRRRR
jgi:hypothetical protein